VLKHPNVVAVKDVLLPQKSKDFDDIYIVTELLDTDLSHLIKSKTKYEDVHIRWILFQLLNGLQHIHSANVFHRDLKPANLLLNAHCDLRICDFGLARVDFQDEVSDGDTPVFWTDYVATRWYRAGSNR
jgi:mitogen-activated protein kinase 1/3